MVGLLDTAPLTGAQGGGLRFSEGISSRARNANVGTASGLSVGIALSTESGLVAVSDSALRPTCFRVVPK